MKEELEGFLKWGESIQKGEALDVELYIPNHGTFKKESKQPIKNSPLLIEFIKEED